jgi:hypothetical protein
MSYSGVCGVRHCVPLGAAHQNQLLEATKNAEFFDDSFTVRISARLDGRLYRLERFPVTFTRSNG